MKNFLVYPIVEYRSDKPQWKLWRVKHVNGKDYLLAYDKDKLIEVYFVGEHMGNYFMSCRTDYSKISHYVVDDRYSVVRRYEKGICNRVYRDDKKGIMTCLTHSYRQVKLDEKPNFAKLYKDLDAFLNDFESKGIKIVRPDYAL